MKQILPLLSIKFALIIVVIASAGAGALVLTTISKQVQDAKSTSSSDSKQNPSEKALSSIQNSSGSKAKDSSSQSSTKCSSSDKACTTTKSTKTETKKGSSSSTSSPSPAPTTTTPSQPAQSPTNQQPVTSGCPALPSYPNASCTGWQHTGVTLKKVPSQVTSAAQAGGGNVGWNWTNGYLNVTQANAVISGIDVNGVVYNNNDTSVNNYFSGLKIVNSLVRGTGSVDGWCVELGPGSTVTDTEIGGGANGVTTPGCIGILVGNYGRTVSLSTITRVNIHHTEHGMRVDGDTLITDSYIHDFLMDDSSNHTDGIMVTAGKNITLRHNRISHGNTSTFFVQWQTGNVQIASMSVEDNYFEGIVSATGATSSYGVYIENKGIAGPVSVKNNAFTSASTWGSRSVNSHPILIPQPIGSPAMGQVCGNKFVNTSTLVGIDVHSSGGTATPSSC